MKLVVKKRFRGHRVVVVLLARRERRPFGAVAATTLAAGGAAYALHRLGRRSGVTKEEAAAHLPGDDVVSEPMWQSTRAITIGAPPEEVWPWIVQMGFPAHRAGWYTPPWLDRVMFGIKQRSAERIVPELQQLSVGDRVSDSDDWSVYFTVVGIEPPHALVLHSTRHVIKPIRTIDFSWAFVARETAAGKTRLFIRARTNYSPRWAAPFIEPVIGAGDYVNARAMLHAIKERVEKAAIGKSHSSCAEAGRRQ
jgi:hypothetical protein